MRGLADAWRCVYVLVAGYVMEKVDLVLLGAEAVVESGGIINMVRLVTVLLSRCVRT